MQSQVERLANLIRGIDSVMFSALDVDGKIQSRPMVSQEREFDGRLWFFTEMDTESIRTDVNVNISYMEPASNRYISVMGHAEIIKDENIKRELWDESTERWFPYGLQNPDLNLICVGVTRAEYWDTPNAPSVETFDFTGEGYHHRPYSHDCEKPNLDSLQS